MAIATPTRKQPIEPVSSAALKGMILSLDDRYHKTSCSKLNHYSNTERELRITSYIFLLEEYSDALHAAQRLFEPYAQIHILNTIGDISLEIADIGRNISARCFELAIPSGIDAARAYVDAFAIASTLGENRLAAQLREKVKEAMDLTMSIEWTPEQNPRSVGPPQLTDLEKVAKARLYGMRASKLSELGEIVRA